MKKTGILLPLFAFILSSCNKIESYPKRIIGGWIINKYVIDSENKTDEFKADKKNYVISYFEDKSYTETYLNASNNLIANLGTYTFDEKSDSLFLYSQTDTVKFAISSINSNALNLKSEVLINNTNTILLYQFVRK